VNGRVIGGLGGSPACACNQLARLQVVVVVAPSPLSVVETVTMPSLQATSTPAPTPSNHITNLSVDAQSISAGTPAREPKSFTGDNEPRGQPWRRPRFWRLLRDRQLREIRRLAPSLVRGDGDRTVEA